MARYETLEHRVTRDIWFELLAWLNYCILKKPPSNRFKQRVVRLISRSKQKDVTWAQIDERFCKIWKSHGNVTGHPHSIVYKTRTKASIEIERSDSVRHTVRACLKELMKELDGKSKRTTGNPRTSRHRRTAATAEMPRLKTLSQISPKSIHGPSQSLPPIRQDIA